MNGTVPIDGAPAWPGSGIICNLYKQSLIMTAVPSIRRLVLSVTIATLGALLFSCRNSTSSGTTGAQPGVRTNGGSDVASLDKDFPVDKIQLLPGFQIHAYAKVPGARSMCLGSKGTLFVGTMGGAVYAVTDTDKNGISDHVYTISDGLDMPNGVAFRDGSLYVAENSRVVRFDSIENSLAHPHAFKVVYDKYPHDKAHGWKFIAFGPDGKLYVPVGAPCNICKPSDPYAAITRMNTDGTGFEIFARGIRNSVGFTWNPDNSQQMWFTDNGRDELGDDLPNDELNMAIQPGMNFGYPYCHQGDTPDPEFGKEKACNLFTPPVLKLGPHVASLGLRFYTGSLFPEAYRKQIFIAEHGSWNRSQKIGYRVMLVKLRDGKPSDYVEFARGWLQPNEEVLGRPVDVQVAPDGALLVSDDMKGVVYRVTPK